MISLVNHDNNLSTSHHAVWVIEANLDDDCFDEI